MNDKDVIEKDNEDSGRKILFKILNEYSLKIPYWALLSRLQHDGFQIKEFSILLGITLPIFLYVLLILEWFSGLWAPLGIFFYGIYLLMFPMSLSMYVKSQDILKDKEKASEIYLLFVLLLGTGFLLAFSQFCRYNFIVFGGFSSSSTGYWHWVKYGVQNIAEAILFDIPSIYEWNISDIKPTSFWAKTLVLIIRTAIEFFIVVKVSESIRNAGNKSKPLSNQFNYNYFSLLVSKTGELIIFFLWSIPLAFIIEGIVFEKIMWDNSFTILVNLLISLSGFWITWVNLQALYLTKGKWSKLLALSGVCLGIWLINSYWDYIIIYFRK